MRLLTKGWRERAYAWLGWPLFRGLCVFVCFAREDIIDRNASQTGIHGNQREFYWFTTEMLLQSHAFQWCPSIDRGVRQYAFERMHLSRHELIVERQRTGVITRKYVEFCRRERVRRKQPRNVGWFMGDCHVWFFFFCEGCGFVLAQKNLQRCFFSINRSGALNFVSGVPGMHL